MIYIVLEQWARGVPFREITEMTNVQGMLGLFILYLRDRVV